MDCEEDAVGKEVKSMMQSLASMDSVVVLRVPFFNVDDVPGCIIFWVTLWIVKRMLSARKPSRHPLNHWSATRESLSPTRLTLLTLRCSVNTVNTAQHC